MHEMVALVNAKRDEFLEELDAVDGRDLMHSEATKWTQISEKVMAAGFSSHFRDGTACKGKWHLILPDYRKIADYHARTGINSEDYWMLTNDEYVAEKLPKSFSKEIYSRIHEWFGRRPQIQPPHVRDLLNPEDTVFQHVHEDSEEDEIEVVDLSADGKNFEVNVTNEDIEDSQRVVDNLSSPHSPVVCGGSPIRPIHIRSDSRQGLPTQGRVTTSTTSPLQEGIPNGKGNTVILSDSNNSFSKRKTDNTGIRRKSLGNQSAVVEVTKASTEALTNQLKAMVSATKETESKKLEVQLKLFAEHMAYQRERDMRIYEQGLLTPENARLAIIKQGEVVNVLAGLSHILTLGLKVQKEVPSMDSTCTPSCEEPPINHHV